MSKLKLRVFTSLLIFTLIISACAGSQPANKTEPPLRVGWSLWPGYYPMAIAAAKGFFKDHNVNVDPVYYDIGSNQTPDIASGMIDGALMVLGDTLLDPVSSQVKIIMVLDNSSGADKVVASPGITSVAELRGKRIGTLHGTFGELFIRQMLAQNNILPSEVTFVQVAPEDLPGAIPNLVDAGHTFDPYTSQALGQGDKIIFTSSQTPGLIPDVVAFRRDIVASRPNDVKAFIAAWFEALQYWKDNPADANAIIAQATNQKVSDINTTGVTLFDQAANQAAFTQGSDTTSLYFTTQQQLQFFVGAGLITQPAKVDDLLDASFLK